MSEQPYDVFLSHNSGDKELVEQLSERLLEAAGIRSWLDLWAIPGGADWATEIEKALGSCSSCAIILGEHGWGEYHLREAKQALARKQQHPEFRIIPVLLPGAREQEMAVIGDFFQNIQRIDFRQQIDDDEMFQRLAAAIRGEPPFPEGRPRLSIYIIRRDARRWEQSARKNKSILYRGRVLQEAQQIAASHPQQMTEAAQSFLSASRLAQQRGRRWLISSLVTVVTLMLLLLWQNQQARQATVFEQQTKVAEQTQVAIKSTDVAARSTSVAEQKVLTEQQERIAHAGELAKQAVDVQADFPQRSLLLANAALSVLQPGDPPVPAAEDALRRALAEIGGQGFAGHTDTVTAVAISPDHHWLVTGSYDQRALLWDLTKPVADQQPLVLQGHQGPVTSVAISPDGHWLATASGDQPWQEVYNGLDKVVLLWNLHSSDIAATPIHLTGHTGAITALAISPDGRWLATGSADNTARLWDLTASDPSATPLTLAGHSGWIWTVAFSNDSHRLATGSRDGTVRVWDLTTIDPTTTPLVLKGHETEVMSAAWSADNQWLVTGSGASKAVMLWDMTLPDPMAAPVTLTSPPDIAWTVAFSPDEHWVIAGGSDYTARIWHRTAADVATMQPIVLTGHKAPIYSTAVTADSRWLITAAGRQLFCGGMAGCQADNVIRLWDLTAADPAAAVQELQGHESFISALSMSTDRRWLVTGSGDHTARLWDMANPLGAAIVLRGHINLGIHAVAVSGDSHWLATAGDDRTVRLWDLPAIAADPGAKAIVLTMENNFNTVALSQNNRWLAAGADDNLVRLWDLTTISPDVEPLLLGSKESTGAAGIKALAISTDSHWLAAGSADKSVYLWDLTASSPATTERVFTIPERSITAVAISANSRWLAAASADSIFYLWDLRATDPMTTATLLRGHGAGYYGVNTLAFSPDNHWLVTGGSQPDLSPRLWDLTLPEPAASARVLGGHSDTVTDVAFSPDSHWLVTVSDDTTARLWDLTLADPSGQSTVLRGHQGPISSVAISADGRWLVTGGGVKGAHSPEDPAARLWDLHNITAAPIVLRGHTTSINDLVITPDNQWIATVSLDDTVRLWPLPLDRLVEIACRTAGRNFRQEEWDQYFPGKPYQVICDGYATG